MRFLDSEWYRSMQYRSFLIGYKVDDRVRTDPEGLRNEVYPIWYKRAYQWAIPEEGGFFDPPTHEQVVERLERMVSDSFERVCDFCPGIRDIIEHPDLLAYMYLNREQYSLLMSVQDEWVRIYEERTSGYERYNESCRRFMDPDVNRFLCLHDSTVIVHPGADLIMEPSSGFSKAHRIVFKDADVIEGELPSRFGGLYEEIGWEDGRYVIGMLALVDGHLDEFTVSCSDISFFGLDDEPLVAKEHKVGIVGSEELLIGMNGIEWYRDDDERTYKRVQRQG